MKTICSTKILAKRDGTFFHKQDIFPEGLVTEMYVVSAYTDVKAIEWLVGELKTPNRCDQRNRIVLKVYLDERYSRFDDQNMRKYLLKIDKLIQSATKANGNSLFSPDSGIFLVKKGSLFHSKLIITKTNQHQRIIIGSLNFTNNALNSNEELVCIRDDDNTFYNQSCNYINSLNSLGEQENYNVQGGNERPNIYVHKVSKSLTISHEKPATLDDYLSSGYLVHPAKKRQLPLYFNLKLPKDVVERELENVENSDLFSGKGVKQSISILLMMKKIAEQKHLKLDVATVKGNDSGKWKSLCIDTPLGMWCPGEKIEELNKKIASVEAIRNHNAEIFEFIEKQKEDLEEMFKTTIQSLSNVIANVSDKILQEWAYRDVNSALNDWRGKIDSILGKRNDESWMEMLNAVVIKTKMPSFFDNPAVGSAFKRAFLNSLSLEREVPYGNSIADEIYKNHKKIVDAALKSQLPENLTLAT